MRDIRFTRSDFFDKTRARPLLLTLSKVWRVLREIRVPRVLHLDRSLSFSRSHNSRYHRILCYARDLKRRENRESAGAATLGLTGR